MKRMRVFYRLFIVFCAGVCCVVGASLLAFRLTAIREVKVIGIDADIRFDPKVLPESLLLFPAERVEAILQKEYPYIANAVISKQFPSTLVIHVTARKPAAVLKTPSRQVLLSSDGTVLSYAWGNEYPVIESPDVQCKIGTVVNDESVLQSLAFLTQISQDENIRLLSVEKDNDSIRVSAPKYTVLISKERNGIESARTLQSVLTGFRIKGQVPRQIDLRFDQPVVNW